jgi:hypothetical protein
VKPSADACPAGSSWNARVTSSCAGKLVAATTASAPASRGEGSTGALGQASASGGAESASVQVWKESAICACVGVG